MRLSEPIALFSGAIMLRYDVDDNGNFIITEPVRADTELVVVENWFEELKAKAPPWSN